MNSRKRVRKIIGALSPHHVAKQLSAARVYRDIAQVYGLVYFGSVSASDDEYEMVRGLTVSADHKDQHYCVGTVEGYDVILLERADQLTFPGKQPVSYKWTVLQIDLRDVTLPHVFIDTRQHQSAFYDVLFAKFARLQAMDSNLFADHDPRFANTFTVYTTPTDQADMIQLLSPDITATLGHHFSHFDFEVFDDRVIVYSSNRVPSKQLIDHMLRAGIWLAREIESRAKLV